MCELTLSQLIVRSADGSRDNNAKTSDKEQIWKTTATVNPGDALASADVPAEFKRGENVSFLLKVQHEFAINESDLGTSWDGSTRTEYGNSTSSEARFYAPDSASAALLQKAINQAVDLCGGISARF